MKFKFYAVPPIKLQNVDPVNVTVQFADEKVEESRKLREHFVAEIEKLNLAKIDDEKRLKARHDEEVRELKQNHVSEVKDIKREHKEGEYLILTVCVLLLICVFFLEVQSANANYQEV